MVMEMQRLCHQDQVKDQRQTAAKAAPGRFVDEIVDLATTKKTHHEDGTNSFFRITSNNQDEFTKKNKY